MIKLLTERRCQPSGKELLYTVYEGEFTFVAELENISAQKPHPTVVKSGNDRDPDEKPEQILPAETTRYHQNQQSDGDSDPGNFHCRRRSGKESGEQNIILVRLLFQ